MQDLYILNETSRTLYLSITGVPGSGQITINLFDQYPNSASSVATLPVGHYARLKGEKVLKPYLKDGGELGCALRCDLSDGFVLEMVQGEHKTNGSPIFIFQEAQPN